MDEPALIARVLAGDRGAFHALLEHHSPPILATLRRRLANREDAREVLQETWLRAYRHLGRLREPDRLRAWLLSIALNLARARLRRPPVATLGQDSLLEPALPMGREAADGRGPGAALEEEEEIRFLRLHLASLPARQREVLELRVSHGLSHAEIAGLLGISEEASRASHYQGLQRLRRALDADARWAACARSSRA